MTDLNDISKHEGGCMCGRTRFTIFAEPISAGYCHCDDCRTATGAAVSAFVGFETAHLVWQGEPLKQFQSSATVIRTFCPECGTSVTYEDEKLIGNIYFCVGAFDDPDSLPMKGHSFIESKLTWLHIDDHLPKKEGTAVSRD
ncbi:MAG: GFA family protein [Chloroflexota bacterium]